MTYPRAHTVNPDVGCSYLCTTRCVRRAFLFGQDPVTGLHFDHRKDWIENRLVELTTIFAIDLTGFSVMSNHYHAVLKTEPERVVLWSDEEVAERWLKLSPKASEKLRERKRAAILGDAEHLAELRSRLGSLSWYMKNINEPIARWANREEGAKGRFWEGRFHAEALLDQAAITAAMAYVDLNPVRAGIVDDPAKAGHTALSRRLRAEDGDDPRLTPLSALGLDRAHYLDLLDWTLKRDQRPDTQRSLQLLRCQPLDWLRRIDSHKTRCRARGSQQHLKAHAERLGQHWLWGLKDAPKT